MKEVNAMCSKKDMTKKSWINMQKSHRVTNDFNTGTRDMKSEKYPSRARQKEIDRKGIDISEKE